MKKLLFVAVALLCTLLPTEAQKKVRVHTIGDSTMADYAENTTRTRGWGEMFQEFFTDDVEVINYARGGRSTRSFINEGLWDKVKANIQKGDYVLIQFAHNDEKGNGTYSDDGRGTDPWGHYKANLEQYVDETRALGGIPILVTPIVRRYFTKEGTISPKGCHNLSSSATDTTLDYVYVMKRVAAEKKVPLIDHTARTKAFIENLGEKNTTDLIYVSSDGTHTQATGAALYAQMVAEEMKRMGILKRYVRPQTAIVLNPRALDFNTLYVGNKSRLCFDFTGLALPGKNGTVTITAPEGMLVAANPEAVPMHQIDIDYTDGKLWNQCFYLYFTPTQARQVSDQVTITCGKIKRSIPVYADCKGISKETPKDISVKKYSLNGLQEEASGITIEKGQWPDDIDESGNRYVEFYLKGVKKNFTVRQITFILSGEVAYRVAASKGGDFYPRTDLGENQKAEAGTRQISLPVNMTITPNDRLAIRFFPWSTKTTDSLYFKIEDFTFEGMEIE
ncbi:MAG: rhamnogalacturonan acetylesterase [Porphyromonadaceae bacterium]|nr:rhamnogalacturonan acetylesterase [Porphyromonadaceae bacterium]